MSVYDEMLAGVAAYLRVIPGISDAIYPAPNSISGSAVAIVYGAERHVDAGQEFKVTGRIRVGLYMAPTDTPSAISAADKLIEPITDQFAANNPGYHLNGQMTSGNVDRCTVIDTLSSQILPYAGHDYFGALIYLDFKYRRFAGGGYLV
jgi:hypothetical protein